MQFFMILVDIKFSKKSGFFLRFYLNMNFRIYKFAAHKK